MKVTFKTTSSEYNRQRVCDDYEGTVGDKSFRVQIDCAKGPHWYDSDLSDDEKDEILNAIEFNERV